MTTPESLSSTADLADFVEEIRFKSQVSVPRLMAKALVDGAEWDDLILACQGYLPGFLGVVDPGSFDAWDYAALWRGLVRRHVADLVTCAIAEGSFVPYEHLVNMGVLPNGCAL